MKPYRLFIKKDIYNDSMAWSLECYYCYSYINNTTGKIKKFKQFDTTES